MRGWIAIIAGIFLYCEMIAVASANASYEKLVSENGARFLVISGEFAPSDQISAFVDAVTTHQATGVTFHSPGGNVYFAMQLGRTIRFMGLDTIQVRASECASACALAFLGGVNRYAEPGSIGVHQNSFAAEVALGRDDAVAATQMATADVLDYLTEMGVASDLLKVALRYEPNDIRYLSGREMAELKATNVNGDGTGVASVQAAPAAAPTESPIVQVPAQAPSQATVVSFVRAVLEAHSENEFRAIQDVAKAYSPTVDYFGKVIGLPDVLADKLAYFKRWPERKYAIRTPTVVVSCQATTCEITGTMDWSVRSLKRNRQAQGAAAFRYVVDTGNMLIVSENSRIVRE